MTRGIYINMWKTKPQNYLKSLLIGVDVSQYIWEICQIEDYYAIDESKRRFQKPIMSGTAFGKDMDADLSYPIGSGNFKGFPAKDDIVDIKTYEDFSNSSCQMIILIADSWLMDVYAKDLAVIKQIESNAKSMNFGEVALITDEHDGRTGMSV